MRGAVFHFLIVSHLTSEKMAVYSIRDLEKLTGIKAHTLRIWEQRYHLVAPARTDTNIRFYTDEHLRHLFNVALLNKQGVKISHIAQMTHETVAQKVAQIAENQHDASSQIDALTLAMINLDEPAFDHIFGNFVLEHGFEQTMLQLVYPFLDKLNVLWLTGSVSPVHEKFIGNLIRRKLIVAIDQQGNDTPRDAATFLLFLPENENQELTLLFMHYLLRRRRHRVVYLGLQTSLSDLQASCQTVYPQFVFTIVNEPPYRQSIQAYTDNLAKAIGKGKMILTGAQFFMQQVRMPSNFLLLNGLPDTVRFLDELALRRRVVDFG